MIHWFNRCELVTLFDVNKVEGVRQTLFAHGVEHRVKTVDRSSPSVFSMASREHTGTLFQNTAQNWRYTIYVKRKDLSKAQGCIGSAPIW